MTAAEIRAFRERHGMTQVQLAEALGLPNPDKGGQVTVARWENGQPVQSYLWRALRDLEREMGEPGEEKT